MKVIFLSTVALFFVSTGSFEQSEVLNTDFSYPLVKYADLAENLEGDWAYDYSFKGDEVFEVDGNYIQTFCYVPYRFEFNKISRKKKRKILRTDIGLVKRRAGNSLEALQFWVDEKGRMRYPKLLSNETDSLGNLKECKIELYHLNSDDKKPDALRIHALSNGVVVLSSYQDCSGSDYHVFVREVED